MEVRLKSDLFILPNSQSRHTLERTHDFGLVEMLKPRIRAEW